MKAKKAPETDLENILPLLIGAWRRMRKEGGPADVLQTREFRGVVAAVMQIEKGLNSDKTFLEKDYFADPELLGAYLLYQWIVHYQEGLSVFNELPSTPRRVLDICSGPGAFAFAALRHGASEVFALDRNTAALELGAEICGRYGMPLNIRKWDPLKGPLPVEGQFDLIIIGHCLEELYPSSMKCWPEHQLNFVKSMLARLRLSGHLVIVENSFIESNRRVLHMRDTLVKEGVPVQAPCVWRGDCPALQAKNSPCYAQREFEKPYLIKEIQRACQINLSSLKMTYIIFKAPEAQWPEIGNNPLYRVISPPIDSYDGKRFYLCGTDGKKNLGARLTKFPSESRAFEYLRRGELISVEDSLLKHNSMDIVEGTKLYIKAACGKPLLEEFNNS
jgi:SAM-dependent methyltransferase